MMDYFQKLTEAFNFAWKYKFLWVFGFILALCMGESNINSNVFDQSNPSTKMTEIQEQLDPSNASTGEVVVFFAILSMIVLFIMLVSWYLGSIARAALIKSVQWDKANESFSLKKGWNFGISKAFRYMWFDLLSFLIILPFFVVFFAAVMVGVLFPAIAIVLVCLLCALSPILILLFAFWAIVHTAGQRYMILRDMGAWESIQAGYKLGKKTVLDYVVGWLVSLIPGCSWAIIMFIIMLCPSILFVAVVLGSVESGEASIFLSVTFCAAVAIEIFAAVISAPFTVLMNTYWTKVTMELMDKKDPIGDGKK